MPTPYLDTSTHKSELTLTTSNKEFQLTSEPALLPTPNKGLPHFPRTDPTQDPNTTPDQGTDLVNSPTQDDASDADPTPYPDETDTFAAYPADDPAFITATSYPSSRSSLK